MSFTRWLLCAALAGLCPAGLRAQAITLVPRISTVAGNGIDAHSGDGGPATAASIDIQGALALDRAGNLYIAEQRRFYVRRVDQGGLISTVAGNGSPVSQGDGGPAASAGIMADALAVDSAGQIYLGEIGRIRRIDSGGTITTVAGHGGRLDSGDGGPALAAEFSNLSGLALDAAGDIFLADSTWDVVRKIDPRGIIGPLAGNYALSCPGAFCTYPYGGDGGAATLAALMLPQGLAVDATGHVYFFDSYTCIVTCAGHDRIRRVDAGGIITTVAGNGSIGFAGDGGPATAAAINPLAAGAAYATLAIDGAGNLYFPDTGNRRIRKIDPQGVITTVAGNGVQGYGGDGGPALDAQLDTPTGIAVDAVGALYFRDGGRVRKVSTPTTVDFGALPVGSSSTQEVALSIHATLSLADVQASGDFTVLGNSCPAATPLPAGTVCTLQVSFTPSRAGPRWFALQASDTAGNTTTFQLQGIGQGGALAFTPGVLRTVAGTGVPGSGGDGGPATAATFTSPAGLRVDGAGNLYIADHQACRVRRIDRRGVIATVAGNGICGYSGDGRPSGDGGPATAAALGAPQGLVPDSAGNLYIADLDNHRVRKVDSRGTISTVAGTGSAGFSGDGGPATQAQLHYPSDLAFDLAGNLYIADENNERIRKVDTRGFISTVAGSGSAVSSGDGGAATSAGFWALVGVATDPASNLYISEYYGQKVRKVDAAGTVSTFAGTGTFGGSGTGDNIPATSATLGNPTSMAADGLGRLYIVNYGGNVISQVDATGLLNVIAGNGQPGYSPDGSPATGSTLYYPWSVAPDGHGNFYFSEIYSRSIRKIDTTQSALVFRAPQVVGTTSAPQQVRLTNAGNIALNFTGFAYPDPFVAASVGNDCSTGSPLAPGASCNLGVSFAPRSAGNPVTGTLLVFDSALDSPQPVALSGNARPAPAAPTVVDVRVLFGSQSYSLQGSTRNRLPWLVSGVQLVFSAPIAAGDAASLPGLAATGFSGLGSDTLTWTFTPQTAADVTASVAVTGAHALRDAYGTPAAAFGWRMRLLCGDANDDGSVSSADMVAVGNARSAPYSLLADLNGDGVVDLRDVQLVRARIGATLP